MSKLLLIIFPIVILGQPNIVWFESYGGSGEESMGHYILSCEDGGILQVGETYDYSNNSSKIFVVKTNAFGQLHWSREINIEEHNLGNSVIELADGYLICGSLDQNSSLIKLDKDTGSTLFIQTNDNGGVDAYEHATKIPDGIVAVGYVHSEDPWNTFFTEGEGYIYFFDDSGNMQHSQSINEFMDQGYRVQYVNDELFISGLSEDASDYALMKMDLERNVIWDQTYGGTSEDHCFGMDVNGEGEIFLAGHTLSGTSNWDTYTIKIDSDGYVLWEKIVGNPRGFDPDYIHDEAWGVRATDDGGCVTIAGTGDEYGEYSECDGEQCSDVWNAYLIKFDDLGEIEWEETFSSLDVTEENYDWAGEDIDLTEDGGAIIAIDNGQLGFLRIDNVQSILENNSDIIGPHHFRLISNYPNPFNPKTQIRYELLEEGFIRLKVYDISGKPVRTLVNEYRQKGDHSIVWNGDDDNGLALPSGIYFSMINNESLSSTSKMLLLK